MLTLRYQEGSASNEARFVEQLKAKYPGVELIPADQYAGAKFALIGEALLWS